MHNNERLDDIVDLCEHGMLTTARIDELLQCYVEALGAQAAVIAQELRFGAWTRTYRIPTAWGRFHDANAKHDHSGEILLPRASGLSYSVLRHLASGRISRDNPLPPALGRFGLGDALITTVHNPFGARLFLAFYRGRGEPLFGRAEANAIRMLEPHVSRAVAMRSALTAITHDGPATERAALRRAKAHAWLIDGEVEWSDAAPALFERVLDTGRRKLPQLAAVLRAEVQRVELEKRSRSFRLGPLRVDFAVARRNGRDETLLLFHEIEAAAPRLHVATKLLSNQQQRVAERLVHGETIDAIAQKLGVGRETIRSHVRVIARRFGAKTRAQLVLRLCDA